MHKIAILPLDDRPQNYGFATPLAQIGGVEPLLPPRSLMGHFVTPGRCDDLTLWLDRVAPEASALVVSLDMLAFGGLIASRDPHSATLEQALERMAVLRRIRQAYPQLPIYGGNVLMRLSITAANKEAEQWWRRVHRWSELHEPRTADEMVERDRLEREIPPRVLAEYQAARQRNHQVNRFAVDLVAEGVLDYLLISQEDCTERGPHRAEQAALLAQVAEQEILDRVTLSPGADEGPAVLLARAVLGLRGQRAPRIYTIWSDPMGAERIAACEDRPVQETLAGLLSAAGGVAAPSEAESDIRLYVHPPGPGGNVLIDATSSHPTDLAPFLQRLASDLAAGYRCALADVAVSNGASPELLRPLTKMAGLADLAGYAAWNTCANTLGTVLAQAILQSVQAEGEDEGARERAHHQFLLERLADDGWYQSSLRGMLNQWLSHRGVDIWRLPQPAHEEAEAVLQGLLLPMVRDLHNAFFADRYELVQSRARFDWPRIFEMTLELELADRVD